jgi:hypothetical protein
MVKVAEEILVVTVTVPVEAGGVGGTVPNAMLTARPSVDEAFANEMLTPAPTA